MKRNLIVQMLALAVAPLKMAGEGGGVVAIEDLMDTSLDDLKDLPGFEVPPMGHYKLLISLAKKDVNNHPSIEAACTVQETLELADKSQKQVEVGTKFSQLFMMDNEWGQGGFKGFVLPIAQGLGITRVGEAVEKIQNVTIAATIKHRYHKEDKDKPVADRRTFANLVNVQVL